MKMASEPLNFREGRGVTQSKLQKCRQQEEDKEIIDEYGICKYMFVH